MEVGNGLREKFQGFGVGSENKEWEVCAAWRGQRWGVRVAQQETRSPVPGPQQAVGWKARLRCWTERKDLQGRSLVPFPFRVSLNFSPYFSQTAGTTWWQIWRDRVRWELSLT